MGSLRKTVFVALGSSDGAAGGCWVGKCLVFDFTPNESSNTLWQMHVSFKARVYRQKYCICMHWSILGFWAIWFFITCCFTLVERKHPKYIFRCLFHLVQLQYISIYLHQTLQFYSYEYSEGFCSYIICLISFFILFLKTWRFFFFFWLLTVFSDLWSAQKRNP